MWIIPRHTEDIRMNARSLAGVMLASLAAACSHRPRESTETWSWQADVPAGATLHLRDVNGDITVRPATGGTLQVRATERWTHGRADAVHFVGETRGNDVSVCAMFGNRGRCSADGYRARALGYGHLFGFTWGSDAHADFVVALPPGVTLDASTVNGGIIVRGATAPVTAKTVNGSVDASTALGPMAASSVNGDIQARVDSLGKDTGPLSFVTVTGNVTVVLPASLSASANLETVTGQITSEFPLTLEGQYGPHHARGTLGAGGTSLSLRTVTGNVTLRKR